MAIINTVLTQSDGKAGAEGAAEANAEEDERADNSRECSSRWQMSVWLPMAASVQLRGNFIVVRAAGRSCTCGHAPWRKELLAPVLHGDTRPGGLRIRTSSPSPSLAVRRLPAPNSNANCTRPARCLVGMRAKR